MRNVIRHCAVNLVCQPAVSCHDASVLNECQKHLESVRPSGSSSDGAPL